MKNAQYMTTVIIANGLFNLNLLKVPHKNVILKQTKVVPITKMSNIFESIFAGLN